MVAGVRWVCILGVGPSGREAKLCASMIVVVENVDYFDKSGMFTDVWTRRVKS